MWWGNLNVSCDEYLNAKCSAVLLVAADAAALPLQCLQKMTAEITRRGRLWPVQAQLFILCVLAVPYNRHAVLTGAQVVRAHEGQRKGRIKICGTKYNTRCLGGGHLSQLSTVSGVCIPRNMQPMWEKDFLTTDPNTPNLLNNHL